MAACCTVKQLRQALPWFRDPKPDKPKPGDADGSGASGFDEHGWWGRFRLPDVEGTVFEPARPRLTLLDGIEVVFNNGVRENVEQPADGIRDSRQESFTLDLPLAKVSNATSAEVTLYDSAGNGTPRRLTW